MSGASGQMPKQVEGVVPSPNCMPYPQFCCNSRSPNSSVAQDPASSQEMLQVRNPIQIRSKKSKTKAKGIEV
jgi:hypothetical protein